LTTLSLRERQRIAVRDELRTAAWSLFLEKGFDAVAVSEIATKVGVAERTFYRYFATKEDAALDLSDATGPGIRERITSAGHDEVVWDVLCEAIATSVESTPEAGAQGAALLLLARDSVRLQAAIALKYREWEDLLASAIATAMGVNVEEDLRPTYLASAALTVSRVASDRAATNGDDFQSVVRDGFYQLGTDLKAVTVRRSN
jgi:AcrR family transcriptional regulator